MSKREAKEAIKKLLITSYRVEYSDYPVLKKESILRGINDKITKLEKEAKLTPHTEWELEF